MTSIPSDNTNYIYQKDICTGYTRKLRAEDEEQFIGLLRAVYKETYSYQFLYEPGNFAALINNKKLISYGEFDANDKLLAHTGFWRKEENSDYVESGSSFRLAAGSSEFKARTLPISWEECLHDLAQEYSFIHQQCTTLHSLAQRYAKQFLRARPCGVILEYARNEQVRGVHPSKNRMHALMMTSVIQPPSAVKKTVYSPKLFQQIIAKIYEELGLPRIIVGIDVKQRIEPNFQLTTIENNSYLDLQRRRVHFVDKNLSNIPLSSARTDLIHLPIESFELAYNALPTLMNRGYRPCGIRPHLHKSDELILQNILKYREVITKLMDEVKIADKNTKLWVELWQKRILRTM